MERKKIKTDASIRHYTCYFDGCCEPFNPGGNMGMGAIIIDYATGEILFEHSCLIEADENNSNNVAEYEACHSLLKWFKDNKITNGDITILGDSKLVINQLSGYWNIKSGRYIAIAKLTFKLLMEVVEHNDVTLKWVPREQNQQADVLSKKHIAKVKDWKTGRIISR